MIALKPGGVNGLALIGATLALIASATAQPDGDQFRIGRVVIDRRLVFEVSSTGGPQVISIAANRIHFLTRERIIANELLFREGERYDHNLVEETERNLRKMDFIGEVTIRRDTVDDHTIDLTVHTRDRWSLELGGAFKQEGGIQTYRLTLQDYNFLGNAQRVKLSLNRRTDRIDPDGLELLFYERRLFGSWWEGRLQYRQAEELTLRSIALRRQYSTEAATWAAGAHTDRRYGLYYHYSQGARDSTFHLSQSNMDAWLSAS
ncbi:MAG: POTRA domain-containing protein, partial [Candidatus Neomarinimicrobiota bacterium]